VAAATVVPDAAVAPDAAVVPAKVVTPPPPDAASAPDAAPAPTKPKPPKPPPPAANEPEDAEDLGSARAYLDQAQAALDAGQMDEAIRLARRSFNEKRTVRGFSLLARAYCRQGDLGNAKAQLSQLPRRERQKVVRLCRRLGVELD
jgi:serine/threonine-protein kinase